MTRLRIGFLRFTSCSGCQLALLNSEQALSRLAMDCELVDFALAASHPEESGALDLALVEGSISTVAQLERLLRLRRRARLLVAVGACALTGGVNVLGADEQERIRADASGSGAALPLTFIPQPLAAFVHIDLEIPGCPPEGSDYLRLLGALSQGGLPAQPAYPVCMECRERENRCLLIEGQQPCLGPVTMAGCHARCPSVGVVCEGCRGLVDEANRSEQFHLLLELGLSEAEVRWRMARFIGRAHEDHHR